MSTHFLSTHFSFLLVYNRVEIPKLVYDSSDSSDNEGSDEYLKVSKSEVSGDEIDNVASLEFFSKSNYYLVPKLMFIIL